VLSSRNLLEGKRPVETMVVRFSSGDEAIVVDRQERQNRKQSSCDLLVPMMSIFTIQR
jgi:hypothetical protein